MSTSNLSQAFFFWKVFLQFGKSKFYSKCFAVLLCVDLILWLLQFKSALGLNVCLFVGCGKKDIVSKYSCVPVCGNTVNEYN